MKNFELTMEFPIHSLFVHFPTGLIPVALLFFLIFLYSRKIIFERISVILLGFSFIFLNFSIITGLLDWKNHFIFFLSPIMIIKIFFSIILTLLILLIWIIRNKHIKQNNLSNLTKGYGYILLYCLLFPVIAVLFFFGKYLVFPQNFNTNNDKLSIGYSLYREKCNFCHPYGQGIYDPFLFPGSEIEFGSNNIINSTYLDNKYQFLQYIRNPKRMPQITEKILSSDDFNYLYYYIVYMKNGTIDTIKIK